MMDQLLESWMSGLIELSRLKWISGMGDSWKPGEKLKLLFTGYNGTRNTGSDVRVEEMLRQIQYLLGADQVSLSVLTQNFQTTSGYFRDANQIFLPDIFPPFLYREISNHHGVVACEGSMFKSKFANALTTMMIGSLGIASAQNKLSIGYGAEAGRMDALLSRMCERYCDESLIITRNEESREVLRALGVVTELGTDTAWTFEPHGKQYGEKVLRAAGWDGTTPVLVLCPINPFWWPVRASLAKTIALGLTGAYRDSHYRSIYFHRSGSSVTAAYNHYITSLARAVEMFRKDHNVFPVLVAMERLDADACHRIAAILGGGAPVFRSDSYDMFQLVSILRCGHLMVSSRYHGIVTSMPGLVPSAGVTMDERIQNLMRERQQPELSLLVDDPDLEEKLGLLLRLLLQNRDEIKDGIGRTVVKNLKTMARMGVFFQNNLQQRYPEFPVRNGVFGWEEFLPPLSPDLQQLVATYDE